MVLRANEPRRSAISSWADPKIRRKSLVKNLPSFLAAIAAAGFIVGDSLQANGRTHLQLIKSSTVTWRLGQQDWGVGDAETSMLGARNRYRPAPYIAYCDA